MHGSRSGGQGPWCPESPWNITSSIYLFIYLFNVGKTHLANIKLFYHVALSNTRNIYT